MLFSVNKIENKIYELSIYKKSLKIPKGVIRIPKSKDGQHMYNAWMTRRKTIKGYTRIYKTLLRKLKIEPQDSH